MSIHIGRSAHSMTLFQGSMSNGLLACWLTSICSMQNNVRYLKLQHTSKPAVCSLLCSHLAADKMSA